MKRTEKPPLMLKKFEAGQIAQGLHTVQNSNRRRSIQGTSSTLSIIGSKALKQTLTHQKLPQNSQTPLNQVPKMKKKVFRIKKVQEFHPIVITEQVSRDHGVRHQVQSMSELHKEEALSSMVGQKSEQGQNFAVELKLTDHKTRKVSVRQLADDRSNRRRNSFDCLDKLKPLDPENYQKTQQLLFKKTQLKYKRIMSNFEDPTQMRRQVIEDLMQEVEYKLSLQKTEKFKVKRQEYEDRIENFLTHLEKEEYDLAEMCLRTSKSPDESQIIDPEVIHNLIIQKSLQQNRKPPLPQPLEYAGDNFQTLPVQSSNPVKAALHNIVNGKTDKTQDRKRALSYIQQKQLVSMQQRSQSQSGLHHASDPCIKELKKNLSYKDIFIKPIGDFNILEADLAKQQKKEHEHHQDLDMELRQFILDSPFKPLVENHLVHMMTKVGDMTLKKQVSQSDCRQMSNALEGILQQIFKPAHNIDAKQSQMNQLKQEIMQNINEFLDLNPEHDGDGQASFRREKRNYLKGLVVSDLIKRKGVATSEEDELFDLEKLKENEELLLKFDEEGSTSRDQRGQVRTFLTDNFPASQTERRKFNLSIPRSVNNQRSKISHAKLRVSKHDMAANKELDLLYKKVQENQQITSGYVKMINQSQAEIKDIGDNFNITNDQRAKMLYLSMIECARQVGKVNRHHALLIVKIFHEYFKQSEHEFRKVGQTLHQRVDEITHSVKKLTEHIGIQMHKHHQRENYAIRMKNQLKKTEDLLNIAAQELYGEEAKNMQLVQRIDNINKDVSFLLPNSQAYIDMQCEDHDESDSESEDQTCINYSKKKQIQQLKDQIKAEMESKKNQKELSSIDSSDESSEEENEVIDMPRSQTVATQGCEPRFTQQVNRMMTLGLLKMGTSVHPKMRQVRQRNLHELLLDDVERLLKYIPQKSRFEKHYKKAQSKQKNYKRMLKEMNMQVDVKDKQIKDLQARCSEMSEQLMTVEENYSKQLKAVRDDNKAKLIELDLLQRIKFELENKRETVDSQVQTVIDEIDEEIIRKHEFEQRLVKYRQVNQFKKTKLFATTDKLLLDFKKGTPIKENNNQLIQESMNRVKLGYSDYQSEIKSLKNILKTIAQVISNKIAAMTFQPGYSEQQSYMNIDAFFFIYIQQTYGLNQLAQKYYEIYLATIETYAKDDPRIELFRKFLGMSKTKYSYNIFESYIKLIRATEFTTLKLFTWPYDSLFIDFIRVRVQFQEMMAGGSQYIIAESYKQLSTAVHLVSENKHLLTNFTLTDYEVFRDLQEQIIRSEFQSTHQMIQGMFDYYHGEIVIDEIESDMAAERTLTIHQATLFLIEHFDLIDYVWRTKPMDNDQLIKRIGHFLTVLVVDNLKIDQNKITQQQMLDSFRERVQYMVPISAYFHIGLNISIDLENSVNQKLERVFQFYCQLEVSVTNQDEQYETLGVREDFNYEGMSYIQFILFLKDTGHALKDQQEKQFINEAFMTICQGKMRSTLFVHDFIDIVRKYKLLPPVEQLDHAVHNREIELANGIIATLESNDLDVPEFIDEISRQDKKEKGKRLNPIIMARSSTIKVSNLARRFQDMNKLSGNFKQSETSIGLSKFQRASSLDMSITSSDMPSNASPKPRMRTPLNLKKQITKQSTNVFATMKEETPKLKKKESLNPFMIRKLGRQSSSIGEFQQVLEENIKLEEEKIGELEQERIQERIKKQERRQTIIIEESEHDYDSEREEGQEVDAESSENEY